MEISKELFTGLTLKDARRKVHADRVIYPESRIPQYSIVCVYCRHLRRDIRGEYCGAFPESESIPLEIWMGVNNHRTPFPGDHGIQFEPKPSLHPDVLKRVISGEGKV